MCQLRNRRYDDLLFVAAITAAIHFLGFGRLGSAEDWPRWRGPRGDGTWHGPEVAESLPSNGLRVAWKSPLGPGFSGIAVVGQRAFTMDKPKAPADSERVVCIDITNGKLMWESRYSAPYGELDYGKGPRCTPTVHDGRVYTLGSVGHLSCLNAETGKTLWQKDLVRDFKASQPTWGFATSLVIHGDKVIVHASVAGGAFIAFHRATGAELWRGGADPTGYCTPIIIARGGREQLVGWTPEHLLSLALDDGRELWRVPYKVTYGVSIATPIFHNDLVLVCGYWEGSKAIRLADEPPGARLAWEENRWLRGLMAQPLYRDGHVYLLDKQHGIVCFRLATGEKVWTDDHKLTPRDRNPQINFVWLEGTDRALGLNAEGEVMLVRFTPAGFTELWRKKIIGQTWAHPAFAGRHVYVRDDAELVCVELPITTPRP